MGLTLTQLKTELTTDPLALGYAPLLAAGAAGQLAVILNATRAGAPYSIPLGRISAAAARCAFDASEYGALTASQRTMLDFYLRGEDVVPTPQLRAFLVSAAGTLATTIPRLQALTDRQGSRAEALFGEGVTVTADHISLALVLP